jgi:hypothetical protein
MGVFAVIVISDDIQLALLSRIGQNLWIVPFH